MATTRTLRNGTTSRMSAGDEADEAAKRVDELVKAVRGRSGVLVEGEVEAVENAEEWLKAGEEAVAACMLEGKQAAKAWQMMCARMKAFPEFEKEKHENERRFFGVVASIAKVCMSKAFETLKKKKSTVGAASAIRAAKTLPDGLFQCVEFLHGRMFALGSEAKELQRKICKICEIWWLGEFAGKDDLVTQCLPMMLIFSLDDDAKKKDVKRVFQIRKMLYEIDFGDDSSVTLKHLLLRCFLSLMYLGCEEGVKFLGELCWISEDFVVEIHETIKAQLPFAARAAASGNGQESSVIMCYAEIYYNAWRGAAQAKALEGDLDENEESPASAILEKIEHEMIQDLMDSAIHVADSSIASALLRLLNAAFHEHKNVKGIDEMLLRLYNPIIWRSLTVANSKVRFNATRVLSRAFPLQDPQAPVAESDALLQKQFSAFETLLKDASPSVRVAAAEGACRMLSIYWELIPKQAIAGLLSILVGELLHDVNSAQCRVAVLRGLELISENPLARDALRDLLHHVSPFIHDTSKAVRSALVSLLLRVKTLRDIKFYDVVKLDHLLERLAMDKQLGSKLTKLLLESFYPQGVSGSEQMERVMGLAEKHPVATLRFFENLHRHVRTSQVCKLIMLLGVWSRNVAHEFSQSSLDGETKELFLVAVRGVAILWQSVASSLKKKEYASTRKQLLETFTFKGFVQPVLSTQGVDRDIVFPLVLEILAQIPCDATLKRQVWGEITEYQCDAQIGVPGSVGAGELKRVSHSVGPAIDCLCHWGCDDELRKAISESLAQFAEPAEESTTASKRRKVKQKKNGMGPFVALWSLQYIVANNPNSARDQLLDDSGFLKNVASLAALRKDPFGFETLLKLAIHVAYAAKQEHGRGLLVEESNEDKGKLENQPEFPKEIRSLFNHCLEQLDSPGENSKAKANSKKRKGHGEEEDIGQLISALMLVGISEASALGVVQLGPESQKNCHELAKHCLPDISERFQARFQATA